MGPARRRDPPSSQAAAELYDGDAEWVLAFEEVEVGAHVGRQHGLSNPRRTRRDVISAIAFGSVAAVIQ